ncbi:MAG: DUF2283 domain-containing protein [Theionarchaea archaeon]|nr:MAG: hypothetical protein AYK18_12020 [Theionarchaea archaeon DG-70]MBU7010240.1 DUF2283 domain-containing protein [Theionarchaea archaeon]
MGEIEAEKILRIVPEILEMPSPHIWIDYDSEADVLYINFEKPAHADESIMSDEDIIYRYEGGTLVGITILNAKERLQQ